MLRPPRRGSFRPALLALAAAGAALLLATPARAQEGDEPVDEPVAAEDEPYELSLPVIAFLRPAAGVSFHPGLGGANGDPGFDLDIAVGVRYELTRGSTQLELIPELGYAFTLLDGDQGHYGFIGAGLRYGSNWIGGATVTNLLLGSRGEGFDLGVRAGLRLEGPLGFVAIEATYEYRALGGDELHGLRLMLLFDASIVLMPMTLTRFGWHFGNRR